MFDSTTLTDKEYKLFSTLVYDKFGISLGEQKRALIAGRLNKVLRKHNFKSFKEYYDYLQADPTGNSLTTLIDRISTNHTYFNRENDHFDYFAGTVIPEIAEAQKRNKRGERELRIWCAGCSSGEESYTLAMLLYEYFKNESSSWDLGILATDISTVALDKAMKGIYEPENVSKLPVGLRNKYMKKRPDGRWEMQDIIRRIILYRRFNLINVNYPFKQKFHVIFCRNVMIYFDKPTRDSLVEKFHRFNMDNGYLFIGHSETLGRDNRKYRYIRPAVYKKATA